MTLLRPRKLKRTMQNNMCSVTFDHSLSPLRPPFLPLSPTQGRASSTFSKGQNHLVQADSPTEWVE